MSSCGTTTLLFYTYRNRPVHRHTSAPKSHLISPLPEALFTATPSSPRHMVRHETHHMIRRERDSDARHGHMTWTHDMDTRHGHTTLTHDTDTRHGTHDTDTRHRNTTRSGPGQAGGGKMHAALGRSCSQPLQCHSYVVYLPLVSLV